MHLIKAQSFSDPFEMTLHSRGSIRRFFQVIPKLEQKEVRTPLSLPYYKTQCVHVEADIDPDGIVTANKRCVNNVVRTQHGFLCQKHQGVIKTRIQRLVPRDFDQEMIDLIKSTENRVIKEMVREEVKISTKGTFTTIKGLRMKNPPIDFPDYDIPEEAKVREL